MIKKTYCKKEKESGKLKYCDAWSFNLSKEDINNYETLKYFTEKATYEISVDLAKAKGFIRETKLGEKKLNIPIKHWYIKNKESQNENTD